MSQPPILNALTGQPLTVAEVAEEREAQAAWRAILSTREGRIGVRWLLRSRCDVLDTRVFVPGENGRRQTDFNLGRQFVGLELMRIGGVRTDFLREFIENEDHAEERPNHAREIQQRRRRARQETAGKGKK